MKPKTVSYNLNEHAIDPTNARTRLSEKPFYVGPVWISPELLEWAQESGTTDQQAQIVLVQSQNTGTVQQ